MRSIFKKTLFRVFIPQSRQSAFSPAVGLGTPPTPHTKASVPPNPPPPLL
jgi:hypothetical protein